MPRAVDNYRSRRGKGSQYDFLAFLEDGCDQRRRTLARPGSSGRQEFADEPQAGRSPSLQSGNCEAVWQRPFAHWPIAESVPHLPNQAAEITQIEMATACHLIGKSH